MGTCYSCEQRGDKKKNHLYLIYKVIALRKVCLLIHPSTHSSSQHTGKWAKFTEKEGEVSVTYKKMLKFTFESSAVSLLILAKIKHLIRKGNS